MKLKLLWNIEAKPTVKTALEYPRPVVRHKFSQRTQLIDTRFQSQIRNPIHGK